MVKKYLIIIPFLLTIPFIFLYFQTTRDSPTSPPPAALTNNPTSSSPSTPENPKKSTPTPLPSKYLIKTAFIEQAPEKNWDQPWQDACEEAALLTVDFYYRPRSANTQSVKQAILDMIDYQTSIGFQKDVNIDQMAVIASDYLDYKTEIITNPTIAQIKQYLLQDIPVVIPANGKQLFAENRHFNDGGPYYHNLVILGYDDRTSKFTVHDVGTRHGAYFKYSYQLLMASIHDFPDSGRKQDIQTGAKKILLLVK